MTLRKPTSGKPAAAKTPKRPLLDCERIMATALQLIEQEGFDEFSTRKLAQALQCEAMSLYHHFPSKAHLLDGLVDRVISEALLPPAELDVLDKLRFVAFQFRATGLRYPQFFKYLAVHRMNTSVSIRFLAGIIDLFFEAGFDAEQSARLFRAFCYYLMGATLDETSGYAKGPSAVQPVPDDVIARDYPNLARVGVYFKPAYFEDTFVWGLELFLEGLKKMLEQR